MCSPTIRRSQNALVLIPCSKQKNVVGLQGQSPAVPNVQPLRNQLLQHIQNTPDLANRAENRRGILNPNAPTTQALDLYRGNFYQVAGRPLRAIMTGQYPSIHVLIVSAFYGIARLNEGLKEYELQMSDTLHNGVKVYQFWQRNQLWRTLQNYIHQNNISFVWSLLPNSPPFPYHRVFKYLWEQLRNTQTRCFHVQVPGAGSGTSYKRAEWLREKMLKNPNYLIRNPNKLERISNYMFRYVPC